MKALKVMANIDDQGQLTLDQPLLTGKNSRVEVIVLIQKHQKLKRRSHLNQHCCMTFEKLSMKR